ncbi:MAG: hypothetical protein K8S97_06210 [Anaerolineae bacterium]|nr:hypothetical protein [Anaerolineae bacterium]
MDNMGEIFNSLGPNSGDMVWNISLYVLFFLNVILLLLIPDGDSMHMLLIIFILMSIIIDKAFAFGYLLDAPNPIACHTKLFIGTYLIRAYMFVGPWIVAGSTSEGKVRGLGIIVGIGGLAYSMGRWFLEQRDAGDGSITCFITGLWAAQTLLPLLPLAYVVLRRKLALFVDGHVPVTVMGELATHKVEVERT